MANYYSKDNILMQRQLKVQKLSVPFVIVGNATAANVSITCDEPSRVFFKTAGVDQITSNVPSGETATYSQSPSDSAGRFNVLILLEEPAGKIVSAKCLDLANGASQVTVRGSSTGVSSPASGNSYGTALMLTITASQALNASNTVDACIEIEYDVHAHQ